MRVFRHSGYPSWDLRSKEACIAVIGNFDGLHLGHRALIEKLNSEAKSERKLVISFYPHPQVVLGRAKRIPTITSFRQKCRILKDWGVDEFHLFHFTKAVSVIEFKEFLSEILFKGLGIRSLVLGPDATIGKGGKGTVEKITEEFKKLGGKSSIVPALVDASGVKISSRRIRDMISLEAQVESAKSLLGRPYELEGRIIQGEGRGKKIGIPTLNIRASNQVLPKNGVYVTRTKISGSSDSYESVTNVGTRPTFKGEGLSVETHILNAIPIEPLLGRLIEVGFIKWLRDEKKFENPESLVSQIRKDIESAKAVFFK